MIWMLLAVITAFPDRTVTPGVSLVLTQEQICTTKWGLDRRHVTAAMRRQIASNYFMTTAQISGDGLCCEYDHLIPRELGGADSIDNMWPQLWADAYKKDRLETHLHKLVCDGYLDLRMAQRKLQTNWKAEYERRFK